MTRIEDENGFKAWLEGRPRRVAVILGARVALRVLPLVANWRPYDSGEEKQRYELILNSLRAMAAAWVAARYSIQGALLRTEIAADAASSFAIRADAAAASFTGDAASFAADAASFAGNAASSFAVRSAAAAARAAEPFGIYIWKSIEADAAFFDVVPAGTVAKLAEISLWDVNTLPSESPEYFSNYWRNLKKDLLAADQDWDVWTEWYEERLIGKQPKWRDIEDFRVTLDEETDWGKGPAYVNSLIRAKIEAKLQQSFGKRDGNHSRSSEQKMPGMATSARKAAQSLKPKPKTAVGLAALSNQIAILVQSEYIQQRIDERLKELLALDRPNHPKSIKALDDEIADLTRWKSVAKNVSEALEVFLNSGNESGLRSALKNVAGVIREIFGPNGQKFITSTAELTVYTGFISIMSHMGLNLADPGVGLVSMVAGGALIGRKTFVDAIKAWQGGKST